MVIRDGVIDELIAKKKTNSANALSSAFSAWRNGMFPDADFKTAAKKLGLLENQYAKGTTNQVSEKELEEIKRDADEIVHQTFPEEE